MLPLSRPFIVEFSGTPEAGKTTAIGTVSNMPRSKGYEVMTLKESAESLPDEIAKGTFDANMWMHFITQAGLLRAIHSDVDVVLVDRGSIDSKFYGYKFLQEGVCSKEQYEAFNKTFVERLKPDLFIALAISPEVSIIRRGGEGRLVTQKYIENYNSLFFKFFETVESPKVLITTTNMDVYTMNNTINEAILKHLP